MARHLEITYNNQDVPLSLVKKLKKYSIKYNLSSKPSEICDMGRYLLKDDPSIEVGSTYQTIGDLFNLAAEIQGIINLLQSAGGFVSNNINNIFNAQMWKDTQPVKFGCKLLLYAKEDAQLDVMFEAYRLLSQTIISDVKNLEGKNVYKIPGLSMGELGKRKQRQGVEAGFTPTKAGTTPTEAELEAIALQQSSVSAKWISFKIPGVINIPEAIVTSAKPTYSKQKTKAGNSIWAEMDLQVESIEPAKTSWFKDAFDQSFDT